MENIFLRIIVIIIFVFLNVISNSYLVLHLEKVLVLKKRRFEIGPYGENGLSSNSSKVKFQVRVLVGILKEIRRKSRII